jgi:hypothetical protein
MLKLPSVTLVAIGSTNIEGMVKALDYSCRGVEYGDVKLVSHRFPKLRRDTKIQCEYIDPITSIDQWNHDVIFKLPHYIETEHAILVHPDGFVVHPESWNDGWLKYDYIGSPWPLPSDTYSYRDEEGNIVRVGNSVSLRSKKLMSLIAKRPMEYHYGNNNEDGQICCWNKKWLESKGCVFAPFEVALYFGRETPLLENKGIKPFLFHRHMEENSIYPNFE